MVMAAGVMVAKQVGGAELKKAIVRKISGKGGKAKKVGIYKRRRTRLLTLSQREELTWIARHLGRTAAGERMAHYRR